jgi:8-oxo-dGTP diphosphatase
MHNATKSDPASTPPQYPMPFVRVELVILAVKDGQLQVLLSHRKEAPYKGKWGLPGGVLRIDLDASLEAAAQRVAQERLNRPLPNLGQVAAVGGAKRDPRAPWAMSVVYRSLVPPDLETTPGKRVLELAWRTVDDVADAKDLAFDHTELIASAVEATRHEFRSLRYPAGWVPEEFTLSELQALSEVVLGERLDKVTFRRRIDVAGVVRQVVGRMRVGAAHRPAQLYQITALSEGETQNARS